MHSPEAWPAQKTLIRVDGSVVLAAILQPFAKEFQKSHRKVSVVLYGSSDPQGLRSLLDKMANIAMMLRKPTSQEIVEAAEKGMSIEATLIGYAIGAVIVHPDLNVGALTHSQLGRLFGGQLANWKEVGGADKPVVVVAMSHDAGAKYLSEEVFKTSFSPKAQLVGNYRRMLHMVSRRDGAVGFVPAPMAFQAMNRGTARIVALKKDDNAPALMPPSAPPKEGESDAGYPLTRPLYLVNDRISSKPEVKEFVEFCRVGMMQMMRKMMNPKDKK